MSQIFRLISQLRPDVELVVGLLVAIAMTIHVLLTKNEVKAAAGWIGLAWLTPLLGGIAYLLFGINRVQRRARRMRGGGNSVRGPRVPPATPGEDNHLEPLRRGVSFITGRESKAGNSVKMLQNGDEAYPVMLAAIAGARSSIGLSSYIMRDDTIGQKFVTALQAAQRRGVQVRVIVDGVGSGWIISPVFKRLREAGLPSERFMHSAMPWRMPFLNLRTHKKILVVDGTVGFTGGINIADQNVLAGNPDHPVQDTHFQFDGPVVGQLVEAFLEDWAFVSGETLDGPVWFPVIDQMGGAEARVVTAGPDQDLEKMEFSVLQAISCARRSIQVMSPYFLPDKLLMVALSLAAMRGVAVDVILPEKSDHRLIDWAMHANVGPLLQDGGRIWCSPPPFRHSKVMVVDGAWCLVGSSNWDMRSLRLNFELCVEVYDHALAGTLEALMLQCRGKPLLEEDLMARSLVLRLRDASARLLLPYL